MKRQEEIRMKELELKYGCNPNQKPSKIYMADGSDLPIKVLMGRPGYINFLDAFNGWQLVRELKEATGLPAAIFHRWHVLMQEQEVQTVCLLSEILLHCPMSATKTLPC